jgi:hypothetical protein
MEVCRGCGQIKGIEAYDSALWDLYYRIDDGRSSQEALVYTGEEFEDSWDDDGETNYALLAMEKDMHRRGLCTDCGRPDLSGVDPKNIMSEEDAQAMHDMWAEQAAERRAGC